MKNKIKAIVISLVLLVMTNQIMSGLSFRDSDGIYGLQKYYDLPDNTVDLLVLGSSHAFQDVNTAYLFDNYGIAAYDLAGSIQPLWNTYYYLTEALKTQNPKVIVLEAYTTTLSYDYGDKSRIIKNNYGIRNPYVRYNSLKVSAEKGELDDYLFSYRQWHSRYTDVSPSYTDKYYNKPMYQFFMGFGNNYATTEYGISDISNNSEIVQMRSKCEEYYRKIIELAQDNNIPIIVVASPYIVSEREQGIFNHAKQIAGEYNVPFYNYNSEEYYSKMDIDFRTDFADEGHLNYKGNVKFTEALYQDLLEIYEFEDHRGDSQYYKWEEHSKDVRLRTANQAVMKASNYNNLIDAIKSDECTSVYVVNYSDCIESNIKLGLQRMNSDFNWDIAYGNMVLMEDGEIIDVKKSTSWSCSKDIGYNTLYLSNEIKTDGTNVRVDSNIMYGNYQYLTETQGIYLIICNNYTEDLVRICRLYINDGEVVIEDKVE